MFKQATISSKITIEGVGLHLGSINCLTLFPVDADTGLVFSYKGQRARYIYPNVQGCARGTNIKVGEFELSTIEHLVSALVGMGIDNCLIELIGDEIPILDGSSKIFAEKIKQAGVETLDKEKNFIKIKQPLVVSSENRYLFITPASDLKITFLFDHPLLDPQVGHFNLFQDDYFTQIAPARTFGFVQEIEQLKQQGLIKGANLDNAILIDGHKTAVELRFPDELVRHKILDLIGDIFATGAIPLGHLVAIRSGHSLNNKLVEKIISHDH